MRVLLCEPQAELAALVRRGLEADEHDPPLEVVGTTGTGPELVDAAARLRPDVAILELWLPELDGLQAIPLVRERSPDTRIVVYSAFNSSSVQDLVAQLGGDAYVDKAAPLADLYLAVRQGATFPAP